MKHVFKKAVVSAAVLASLGAATTVNAAVKDNPRFQILPVVIVWGGDGDGNAQVADFLIGSGTSNDLISADVTPVMTGTLTDFAPTLSGNLSITAGGESLAFSDDNGSGILDAGDSIAAFAPTATVSAGSGVLHSSFYVASNTGFSIQATVNNAVTTGDISKVTHQIGVTTSGDDGVEFGESARSSLTDSSGYAAAGQPLNTLNGTTVFSTAQSTATGPGTIAQQSVRFDNTYTLDASAGGLEIDPTTAISTEVTYVVANP